MKRHYAELSREEQDAIVWCVADRLKNENYRDVLLYAYNVANEMCEDDSDTVAQSFWGEIEACLLKALNKYEAMTSQEY